MKTKIWAIMLILFIACSNAFALYFIKRGTEDFSIAMLYSWQLYLGLGLMVFNAILMIIAFRGGKLSVLYPLLATTYIWITLISMFLYGEDISPVKWAGIGLIVIGVGLIGGGEHK